MELRKYFRLVKVFPCLAVFMSSFTILAIAVDRHRMICRPTYRQVRVQSSINLNFSLADWVRLCLTTLLGNFPHCSGLLSASLLQNSPAQPDKHPGEWSGQHKAFAANNWCHKDATATICFWACGTWNIFPANFVEINPMVVSIPSVLDINRY